ncbi:MAG: hypothetical protein EBZ59_05375 [Planctomycetia bacterium]|nr:hypothetical protein [Planctomycetia bacterium]
MSSRERWTVYPLLFLAIGLALRAAAVPNEHFARARVESLEATRLVCKEIVVGADDGTILVHIGRVVGSGGGRIEVKDRAGVDAVAVGTRPEGRDGAVEFFDERGAADGRLTGSEGNK